MDVILECDSGEFLFSYNCASFFMLIFYETNQYLRAYTLILFKTDYV